MEMNMMKRFLAAAAFVLAAVFSVSPVYAAAFDLSYSLVNGGSRLELSPDNAYKGVQVTATSNAGTRYQIIQRLMQPLQSRDNPSSIIRGNFVVRGLIGSNKFGDFRIPSNDAPVSSSDTVLYYSSAAGNSDNFTLVYGITQTEKLEPGYYYGRIAYVLMPIKSTASQVVKILDVYVNISADSGQKPTIEVSTVEGGSVIRLNPAREGMQSKDVTFKINGKFRKQFNIIQAVPRPLESPEGNRLDYDKVQFVARNVKKGTGMTMASAISMNMQTVYSSRPNGESDDSFVINYTLGALDGQKAGKFRSGVQYMLDYNGRQDKLDTFDLEVENERVFNLEITPGDQKYSIEFPDVKPIDPPKKSEVLIEVTSNIGKRYQVSQEVSSELSSGDGKKIPSKNFTMRAESVDTKGTFKVTDGQEVKKGGTTLFVSDNKGSSDNFKVVYTLECSNDIIADSYSARVTYTLLEL